PAPDDPENVLLLDAVYADLNYTSVNPGFAVLLTDGVPPQILEVIDSRPSAKVAYSISAKATRLVFDEAITTNTFSVRQTVVLTGSELLTLQGPLTLPEVVPDPAASDPAAARLLMLSGVHTQLRAGQTVLIRGNLLDALSGQTTNQTGAELAVIDAPPQI